MSIVDIPVESAGALQAGRSEVRGELLRELVRSPMFVIGAIILLFWIVCAIFGPAIAPHDPLAQNLEGINKAPSSANLFGTDQLGRDVFSRVIVGVRDVMIIAPLATLLGTVLGTAIGLLMGYFRGLVDDVFGRFVEAFLALPVVITGVIALSTLGRSNLVLIVVIGLLFTPLIARTVRAAVLLERELDYVAAARLRGEGALYIMFVEILPNVFAPIMVEFTVRLAYAIFAITHPDLPRSRHPAADGRLGARHLGQLRRGAGRILVGGDVRRDRDHHARGLGDVDLGLDPGRVRAMSTPPTRSRLTASTSPIGCAGTIW